MVQIQKELLHYICRAYQMTDYATSTKCIYKKVRNLAHES